MTALALLRRYASPWRGPLAEPARSETIVLATGSGIEIVSRPELEASALPVAEVMLARYEGDVEMLCRIFGVARPEGLRVVLRPMPIGLAAAHRGQVIYCDLPEGTGLSAPHPLRSCHLLATQLVELLAAEQDAGWDAGSAHGEALSRVLGGALYPGWRLPFRSGGWWFQHGRPDVVTTRTDSDDDPVAVGGSVLFLHYLHDALDHDWTSIVRAGAPTLAATYRRLRGGTGDPFSAFHATLEPITGGFPKGNIDNPFSLPDAAPPPSPTPGTDPLQASVPVASGPAAVADQPAQPMALVDALAHRRWWIVRSPMCHIRAENVFVAGVYESLVSRFRERLAAGEFTRSLPGYDASAAAVTRENAGPFSVFLSREWHDMLAGLFGVKASGDVNVTLHHHAPDSASGTLHNDLNPGWFAVPGPDSSAGEINVHDPAECNYRTGQSLMGRDTVERIRAIGLIYYLDTPADVRGGGTGLYRSARQAVLSPDVLVPPRNNSLVAFECTPFSFHSFISNAGAARDCVTMWLHRDIQDAVDRWGPGSIVGWS